MNYVGVNFDMSDYLPSDTPSTIGTELMQEEFDGEISNLRIMIEGVSIPEVLQYKEEIANVDGISLVQWFDDSYDITVPLATYDQSIVERWYINNTALLTAVVDVDVQAEAIDDVRKVIGENGYISGDPVDTVTHQASIGSEMATMMKIVIPLILVILIVTTSSWIEPVLFMINIGVAILLNMGTNIFMGEISFITKTTCMLLQLACSMDYAIILLDEYKVNRNIISDPIDAMAVSIKNASLSIISSGLTTVVGFAVLVIIQFKIGQDLGIVLSKGIILSLLTTLLFMPCVIIYSYNLIAKTSHRSFIPSFSKLAKFVGEIKYVFAGALVLLVIPGILAQGKLTFTYGISSIAAPDSEVVQEKEKINSVFGESISLVVIVPGGDLVKEETLSNQLKQHDEITKVLSYSELVGNVIPTGYISSDSLKSLQSETYSRIILTAALDEETDKTFLFIEQLRNEIASTYDEYYLVGESVSVLDLKDTVISDKTFVNLLSILAIAIILMLNFRSLSIPLLLILTIECGIYINTAIPYFTGTSLNYIGYLVISSVQLGATVDYAILFSNHYIDNRRKSNKKIAIFETLKETSSSILTSGLILISAGLIFGLVSSNGIISQLGILIARGTTLSVISVFFMLPSLLTIFDGLIKKTTWKANFHKKEVDH